MINVEVCDNLPLSRDRGPASAFFLSAFSLPGEWESPDTPSGSTGGIHRGFFVFYPDGYRVPRILHISGDFLK